MSFLDKLFFPSEFKDEYKPDSITVQGDNDGTVDVSALGQFNQVGYWIAQLPTTEVEAIKEYRKLAMTAEVDEAVQEIVNESFNIDQQFPAIDLTFRPESKLSSSTQKKINDVYYRVYHDLFDFDNKGGWLFRKWYVDGRLFIHKVLDKNKKSIAKLQVMDALQVRRIKNSHSDDNGLIDLSKEEIMYFYVPQAKYMNEIWGTKNYNMPSDKILMFPEQAIAYIDSGMVHYQDGYIVSQLSKTIVPYNNMKMMEDAMVIYRVIRSPSRRVFYVDVADMPKSKGEQYLKDMMNQFKNKMTYDANSGVIADRRNILSMLEDIWLPRKSNGRSTEVSTLEEGSNLGVTEDVEYCRDRFYRSLNVPRSRFNQEQNPFGAGRVTEISRDELRFQKFIQSLRNIFIGLIEDVLKTELILTRVISESDWKSVKRDLVWIFAEDNRFVEMKQNEILEDKLNALSQADGMVEKYFSIEWALKTIMHFNDNQIEEIRKQREGEQTNGDFEAETDFRVMQQDQGPERGRGSSPSGTEPESDNTSIDSVTTSSTTRTVTNNNGE